MNLTRDPDAEAIARLAVELDDLRRRIEDVYLPAATRLQTSGRLGAVLLAHHLRLTLDDRLQFHGGLVSLRRLADIALAGEA